ncbi:MAG: hypothetical protein RLY43_890 [Bacteroidota bacterium]|jgi:type I restriction enzyme S subunit
MSKESFSLKLSEIADVVAGQSPESIYYSNIEGVPFLQGNRTFGTLYPSIDTYTSKVTKLAKKDEVLMSVRAPVGDLNFAPCDLCIGRGLASIKAKDGNNKFIYYALKYNINNLLRQGSGTTFDSVNKDVINDFELILPKDKADRDKVTNILSALDYKIELNNRINAELEAMAKTLYDYWFVQFDFPDENGKPYKTSGGKMIWNEELKREIPEGWEVEILNNNVSCILDHRGKTPLKLGGDWVNKGEGVIALSAKHVKDGKLVKLEDANIVSYDMYERWMPEKLKDGDILMTSEAPLGEFYFILNDTNYCMSQRLFAIRADKSKILSTYLYYELSKGNGYSQLIGKASGSTVFGIRQDELRKVNILKPKLDLQITFDDKIKPMLLRIRNNEFQNQKLTELRDWLLPMLMNGQVTIKSN